MRIATRRSRRREGSRNGRRKGAHKRTGSRPGRCAHRLRLGQKTARIATLRPSPENRDLYRPEESDLHSIRGLIDSIKARGVEERLRVTLDGYIVSGHRRLRAAAAAGLKTVPITVEKYRRVDDLEHHLQRMVECNQHRREKTFDERVREQVVSKTGNCSRWDLVALREERGDTSEAELEVGDVICGTDIKTRKAVIADERMDLLEATMALVERLRKYWPLGMRRYFYGLLDVLRLMRNTRLELPFASDRGSYRATCNVINDAMRLGHIDRGSVADETRPVVLARCWSTVGEFFAEELDGFLFGYHHDLLRSQPNAIEVVGEKLTVQGVIQGVCEKYTLPLTIGRGFCSPPPLREIAMRFADSGRENLILLCVVDCDPEGLFLPGAVGKTLLEHSEGLIRPDQLKIVRVALTMDQVEEHDLRPSYDAESKDSSRKAAYLKKYGTSDAYELEAAEPETIAKILDESIRSFLDLSAFNREIDEHNRNLKKVNALKRKVRPILRDQLLGGAA